MIRRKATRDHDDRRLRRDCILSHGSRCTCSGYYQYAIYQARSVLPSASRTACWDGSNQSRKVRLEKRIPMTGTVGPTPLTKTSETQMPSRRGHRHSSPFMLSNIHSVDIDLDFVAIALVAIRYSSLPCRGKQLQEQRTSPSIRIIERRLSEPWDREE